MLKSVSKVERNKYLFIYLTNIGSTLPKQFREFISYGGLEGGRGGRQEERRRKVMKTVIFST